MYLKIWKRTKQFRKSDILRFNLKLLLGIVLWRIVVQKVGSDAQDTSFLASLQTGSRNDNGRKLIYFLDKISFLLI